MVEAGMESPIRVPLPTSVAVPAAVWVTSEELIPAAMDQAVHANWLLAENMAGMHLVPEFKVVSAGEMPGSGAPAPCSWVRDAELAARVVSQGVAFRPGAANIYFGARNAVNQACQGLAAPLIDAKARIIYIGSDLFLTNLTHEVAHIFGLADTDFVASPEYSDGHTNDRPPFACNNALWRIQGVLENHLSAGQVFWANFHTASYRQSLAPSPQGKNCEEGGCIPWCVDFDRESPALAALAKLESCSGRPPTALLASPMKALRNLRSRLMRQMDSESLCHVKRLIAEYEAERGCVSCAKPSAELNPQRRDIVDVIRDLALDRNRVCEPNALASTLRQRFKLLEDLGALHRGTLPAESTRLGPRGFDGFLERWQARFHLKFRFDSVAKLTATASKSTPALRDKARKAYEEIGREDPAFLRAYERYSRRAPH